MHKLIQKFQVLSLISLSFKVHTFSGPTNTHPIKPNKCFVFLQLYTLKYSIMIDVKIMKNTKSKVRRPNNDGINKLQEKNRHVVWYNHKQSKTHYKLNDDRLYSLDAAIEWKTTLVDESKFKGIARRKVTFDTRKKVREVALLSESEAEKLWYSKHEYQSFAVDCMKTVMAYRVSKNRSILLDPDLYTLVGLENEITDHHQTQQRRNRIGRHKCAVLSYQYNQRCNTVPYDPDKLRRISESFSLNFFNEYNLMMNL